MPMVLAIDTDSEGNKTVFHRTFLLMDNRAAISSLSSSVCDAPEILLLKGKHETTRNKARQLH
eukprot:2286174-Ditylum_brightwellii.AAC.1